MLSKYGLSREEVHFGYTIESALPIVTDIEFPTILEEDMQILSKKFKETIGRFLQKKRDNRNYYKKGKNFKFSENELVMRQVYAPNNLLSNTFSGPYRVTSVSEKGAILRDIKSGDICSVSFEHLRKITFNELLSLIPGNFEAEIMKQLDQYRYNRKEREVEEKVERQVEEPWQEKKLRSGKTYSIKIEELDSKWTVARDASWTPGKIDTDNNRTQTEHSILTRKYRKPSTVEIGQKWTGVIWSYNTEINMNRVRDERMDRNRKSTFKSSVRGTLTLTLDQDRNAGMTQRVKFSTVTVWFY